MRKQLCLCTVIALLLCTLSACSTAPASQTPHQAKPDYTHISPAHLSAAKAFLNNIGAGHMAMLGYQAGLQEMAQEQPGMAELVARVLSDVTPDDFLYMAATAYAHYLSEQQLNELARLSEDPAIAELFQTVAQHEVQGKQLDSDEMAKHLNADQLTAILRFGQSDSARAMKQALPDINRDMEAQVKAFAEDKMIRYLKVL
ncbi:MULTISPECIES: hypothetical protein [Pseudomonadaceae]|uniref:hypothetical protein n=1 Tax=Pseudomonadaceae TaxID=135621 RepID=UPI003001A773